MARSRGIKMVDSSPQMTVGSKADEYWIENGISPYFKVIRPKLDLPKAFMSNDLNLTIKKFNIVGINYGNWLTVEDRINYTYSLILSLYDLNKILRFNYNVGFDLLGISFGGRGSGSALAHFEPHRNIINITRYSKADKFQLPKDVRFFGTGGLGSLAHEYGHFLDYFAGEFLSQHNEIFALTGGRSVSKKKTATGQKLRDLMDDIIDLIIWKKPGEYSAFYKRLLETIGDPNKGEYWIRRNELFARAFEVYCSIKLEKLGIKNLLLVHQKYSFTVYLKKSEMDKIEVKIDQLLDEIRKKIN